MKMLDILKNLLYNNKMFKIQNDKYKVQPIRKSSKVKNNKKKEIVTPKKKPNKNKKVDIEV